MRLLLGLGAAALLAACGPLATSCPFVLFGGASPTVGGQVRVPIGNGDTREVPASGADVSLADAQAQPLPGVHAQSAKDGSYALPNTEPGYAYVVLARVKGPDGTEQKLKGLAQPGQNGDTADVNESSTILTTGLTDGLTGMLGAFDDAAYDKATALVYTHIAADGLPDLKDKAAITKKLDGWKATDPTLKQLFDGLRNDLSRNQPPLAQVLDKLATRDHQPTPGPVSTGTPAPSPITTAASATPTAEPPPAAGNNDGPLAAARFNGLGGMAFDNDGNLYVADASNHRVRKIVLTGPDSPKVEPFAGTGSAGNDDGIGDQAQLNDPRDVVFDGDHTLYVAEATPNRIRAIDVVSRQVTAIAGGQAGGGNGIGQAAQFDKPVALAYARDTKILYIAEDDDIRALSTQDGVVTTLTGAHGKPNKVDGAALVARFNTPQGLALSGKTLFVSDTLNHLIRQVDLTDDGKATAVSTIAGVYEAAPSSKTNAGTDNGPALTTARFNTPVGLALDADNRLYIADRGNRLVRRLSKDRSTVETVGSSNMPNLLGKTYGLVAPAHTAFDGTAVFLSDSNLGQLFKLP